MMTHLKRLDLGSLLGQRRVREALITIPLAMIAGLLVLISTNTSTTFVGLYLMAVVGLVAAAVVGNLRRFMLVIVIADVALGMDKSFLLQTPHQGGAKGIEISLTTLVLIPYWFMWLAEARHRRKTTDFPPNLSLSLPTVGMIIVSTLSMIAAQDLRFSIFGLARLLQFLLLYACIVHHVQNEDDLRFVLNTMMAAVLAESLLIIAQYITKSDFQFIGFGTDSVEGFGAGTQGWRPGGTFGAPNVVAAYLVPHLMLIFGLFMSRPTRLQKYLGVAAVGTGLVALIVAQSRAGWSICLAMGALLAILALRRRYVKFGLVLFLALIVALIAISFSGVIIQRLTTDDHESAQDRLPMMRVAYNMVIDNPIVGVGANNYAVVMSDYPGLSTTSDFAYVVHNRYLFIWAEIGTLGLLCLIWFVAEWLANAYRAYRLNDPHLSPLALGMFVGIIGSLITWNVESLPGRQEEQAIWMLAALAAALYGLAWRKMHRLTEGQKRDTATNVQTLVVD